MTQETSSRTELELAREEFEQRWLETRTRLSGELGVQLRRTGWLTLLLAGAVGLAAAVALKGSRGGSPKGLPEGSD